MSLLDKEAPQWELSKENIQPLKQGRNTQVLNKTLSVHAQNPTASLETRRQKIRQRFEQALKSADTSADPIQIWQDYCRWILDEYPEGDSWRSELHPVIERMMDKFKDDERYKDDGRYVRMWIRYADLMPNTEEVLSFMRVKGIGQKAALFYEANASVYELKRNYALAEATYVRGIEGGAEPVERLEGRFRDFKRRMKARAERAKKLAREKERREKLKEMDPANVGKVKKRSAGGRNVTDENDGIGRSVLGGLSERQAAQSHRTSARPIKASSGLSQSTARPMPTGRGQAGKSNNTNATDDFEICEDPPADIAKPLTPKGSKFPRLPKRNDTIKENNASGIEKWSGTTLDVKTPLTKRRQSAPASNFTICEDDDNTNEITSREVHTDDEEAGSSGAVGLKRKCSSMSA